MKLHLLVNDRVLASVPVEASCAANDYYLKAFRRLLLIRHHKKLVSLQKEPNFFVDLPAVAKREAVVQ